MNKAVSNGKKYTARELAERFGCSVATIQRSANALFGKGEKGARREFDEVQTTAILERIKNPATAGKQATSATVAEAVETALSPILQLKAPQERMTVREVAEVLGVTREAVKKHLRELYPELMVNGLATYLTEEQVTAIKQKMMPTTKVAGALTSLDIERMTLQVIEYHKAKIAELEAENGKLAAAYGREVLDHKATRALLEDQKDGTAFYQRVAESAGLVLPDRDDLLSAYRRGK